MKKFTLILLSLILALTAVFFTACDFNKLLHFMHKDYEWVTESEATCYRDGLKYKHCLECDKIYDEEVIPQTNHQGGTSTCGEKATCQFCGQKYGDTLPHSWIDATCKAPKTCRYCSTTEGDKADHDWKDATCISPEICSFCDATNGQALGHEFENGTCTRCGESSSSAACPHLRYSVFNGEYYSVVGINDSCDCEIVYIPAEYDGLPVGNIGTNVFKNNFSIKGVVILNGMTRIGASAFENCTQLKSIVISGVTTNIGNRAFYGCTSLTEIYIPSSVIMVGDDAFKNCISLSIKCGAESKPNAWSSLWNSSNRPVEWGVAE